ncbi:MAG: 1-acyl-sn-glycerol-3-phosphate acyltransferase [Lewinellaceae bacterium]|nr:1-acyl-sn-glycerol-3-phosphate acyltransferase [Lewinellaceae bacterium]
MEEVITYRITPLERPFYMLYTILKPLVAIALKTTYRNIDLIHPERIPPAGPVIFVANHPTAFIDPVLVAVFQDRTLYFLTRGDYFNSRLFGLFLTSIHVKPLYRMNESGFTKVKSNLSTINQLFHPNKEREAILVSVEGNATHEKRMRPVKKGAARIAFDTLETKGIDEIYLVPVGFTYTYAEQFRSQVMMIFDNPIKGSDFLAIYQENKARGITALTEEIKKRLEANVVILNKDREDVAEAFFILYRSEHPRPFWPVISHQEEQLFAEKAIADQVNAMDDLEYNRWDELQKTYFSTLRRAGFEDGTLVQQNAYTLLNTLLLVVGCIPAALGYLWSWLPLLPGKYLAENKVRRLSFKISVQMGVALGAFLVYTFLWLLINWLMSSLWIALSVPLLFMAAYFCIWYVELWKKWRQGLRLKRCQPEVVEVLHKSRVQLKAGLDSLLD